MRRPNFCKGEELLRRSAAMLCRVIGAYRIFRCPASIISLFRKMLCVWLVHVAEWTGLNLDWSESIRLVFSSSDPPFYIFCIFAFCRLNYIYIYMYVLRASG